MEFSHDVIGPDFDQADLVSFDFGNVEVSFRLPEHRARYQPFLAPQDLSRVLETPEEEWYLDMSGAWDRRLVKHSWDYIDGPSENLVAVINLEVRLVKLPRDAQQQGVPLSKKLLADWILAYYKAMAIGGTDAVAGTESELRELRQWQMPASLEEIERYAKGALDWLMITKGSVSMGDPRRLIYIPLNEQLMLMFDSSISIISTDHASITISKKEIDQLKRDILMEVLSHIRVNYSPEVQALIQRHNG